MKRKYQKSRNGKPRKPAKKTIELFPQKAEDNLGAMKRSNNNDEVCESSKTTQRNLRTRNVQNYSERSKVLKAKPVQKDAAKSSPEIVNGTRIPIYKAIKLEEEKVQSLDSIYEFIDDLPGCDQKVKKRKKSVRKPSVKRAKKLPGFQYNVLQKTKLKAAKNVSKNVQFKEQKKQPITEPEKTVKHNIYANIKIPEHLQNAGDSTIAEASTIIIPNQGFEQSDSSSLNKWDTTVQLDTQESSMSNHSLIAQSISPITKEVDNLFIGSPRKSADTFSQIQNVVQSTPQRVLTGQDKKQLLPMNLNLKSLSESENQKICSKDPIHLSSTSDENIGGISQIQKESISSRKFSTVISNANSAGTTSSTSVLLQKKQQSPLKAVPSSTSFDNNETDQITGQGESLSTSSKKQSKVKILKIDKLSTPLKFEDILKSYKLMVSNVLKSNTENINSQKENKNPDPITGPSNLDSRKSKAVILRQSNLNNFLNLDEMPESTSISTVHGIFSDVNNSTVNGKKLIFNESNTENQLDINNSVDRDISSPIKKSSIPIIATARDVARSVKGKLFVKARVKSSLTRRVPESLIKKTLLKNAMQENISELNAPLSEMILPERNIEGEKSKSNLMNNENKRNKIVLHAESEESKSLMEDKNDKSLSLIQDQNGSNASLVENENKKSTNIMQDQNDNVIMVENENEKSTNIMQDQNDNNIILVENENEKSTNIMQDQSENNLILVENKNEKSTNLMQDENENDINLMDYENEKIPIFMEVENENNVYLMENENENNTIHIEDANENITSPKDTENTSVLLDSKKAFLDSVSFSDTFDFLSENGEDESLKIPEDLPLFVDLEPVHFSQPPRRSYIKTKKAIRFNRHMSDPEGECSEEDDYDKPKKKRKRVSKLSREEQKKMQQWIKSVNEEFKEIEEFNLTVE